MKGFLVTIGALALLLAVVGAVVVAFAGVYQIAADDPHWPAVERALEWARMRAVSAHASTLNVPALGAQAVRDGARQYDEMCVVCHLAPGDMNRAMHDGMYPRPPDLTKASVEARQAFCLHGRLAPR